jgi:1-acyl-sn-glycerol-3-phosphate acyltransferase
VSTPIMPSSPTPKPISDIWRPDLTRLPVLTGWRRIFRAFIKFVCRGVVFICTRTTISGLENYPRNGPALIVINHLGDPDAVLVLAALPDFPEVIGKIELRSIPILCQVMDMLGVIWIHRGRPDRRAISVALDALQNGRRIIIAPEGRESTNGALEKGTQGAAFLALKSGVPVVPVTITGSEFRIIENGLKKFQRKPVSVKVGKGYTLQPSDAHQDSLEVGTRLIMESLARQLPPRYRGVYAYLEEQE